MGGRVKRCDGVTSAGGAGRGDRGWRRLAATIGDIEQRATVYLLRRDDDETGAEARDDLNETVLGGPARNRP